MHPVTHLLAGWALANAVPLERRDRALVTLAGVIPDLDGLGVIGELLTEGSAHPLYWYEDYHHVLLHNLCFGLVLAGVALALARRRALTATLVLLSFHLHLLGDLVGSRGPDGYRWPIAYLYPFSARGAWEWEGQWALKAWPNVSLTLILLALTLTWSWRRGRSPLELLSEKGDAALAATLRARFGEPGA